MRVNTSIAVVLSALVAGVPMRADQELLASVKALYASASYEEALTVLGSNNQDSSAMLPDAEQYRALCQLALGRTADAQRTLEALITRHPLYTPGAETASPQMRITFHSIRARLLPAAAQQLYATARASYDDQDYEAAVRQFGDVLTLLRDPDAASTPASRELAVVAEGFRELSRAAGVPAAAPSSGATNALAATPAPVAAGPVSPVERPGQPARAVAPATASRHLYDNLSRMVTPPVVIRQDLPAWIPRDLEWQTTRRGVIDVVINELGHVESATIVKNIHPGYDQLVVKAAKNWTYEPATIDNKPVRFVKRVAVELQPK